jgi:hypothetical protein
MNKLLELENRLRKAKEELEKQMVNSAPSFPTESMDSTDAMKAEHKDEKEDKKMIAEALDDHNEKKHGEPKDEDSAFKSEKISFNAASQWQLENSGIPKKEPKMKSMHGPVKIMGPDSKEVKEANKKKKSKN